jgi:hypothetical protein
MKTTLLAALLTLAVTLGICAAILTRDLDRLLGETSATVARLDQTFVKVNSAADTLNAAAGEERANWRATSSEAAKTGRALRMLISRVDRSFVDGTLQHVNRETLPAIDSQIAANGEQLKATLAKLGDSADGLTAVERSLNLRLDDPQIPLLLGHFNASAANLETISANGVAMSADMKLAVHRMAQPPTKFHEFVSVAWTTAKFGALFVP